MLSYTEAKRQRMSIVSSHNFYLNLMAQDSVEITATDIKSTKTSSTPFCNWTRGQNMGVPKVMQLTVQRGYVYYTY